MPATQAGTLQITAAAEREIVMTRVFDAPRALVFDAFTKPELIRRWLAGPPGWEMVVCDVDLQVGGSYRWFWRREKAAAEGSECGDMIEMGVGGVYREVVPNEKLVFTWAWHTTKERESLVTITIKPNGDGSMLTLLHEKFFDEAARDGHKRGWSGSFDKLEKLFT